MSTPSASRSAGSAILATSAFALLFLAVALPGAARAQDRYGYYRVVEGNATLIQLGESGGPGEQEAAQENQPLLTGDRLWTARGSRVEVVLADNTMVRLGGESEVAFDDLAGSGDGSGEVNLLTLRRGELQLVSDGAGETRVDTDNATLYLPESGSYRIETRDETTLLVVRSGRAEVRTRRGAITVDEDEEAWIEGDESPEVQAAGTADSLERWASNLDDQYQRARWDDDYVDPSLSYASVRMAEYGSWVTLSNRRVWRPRVGADWSPYRHGRWVYTRSGLTWSSYEPWGWVPYHYGSWDYTPGWGWAWYPGRTYAPAWVYWYWGPSYVGWCPFGYYSHYYGPRWYSGYGVGLDFTWGFGRRVHGWAGGSHWDRWNFVDCNGVFDRRLGNRTRTAVQLGGHGNLPRGIITTETRGLKPDIATRPSQGMLRLASDRSGWEKPVRELPDVSRFVARDPNVGAEVGRIALPVDRNGRGGRESAGNPGGNGRWAPGEKPAIVGGAADDQGGATRRATSRPDWRSGNGAGVAGAGPSGARNGRPSDGTDGWRGGVEQGPAGGNGRGPSARVPGSGVTGKPSRPSSDGGHGVEAKPGSSGATGARPRGGSDESWRGDGREGNSAGRSPVRRIVEGVRSNGQANDDDARTLAKPSYGRSAPQRIEPRSTSPRPQAPSTIRTPSTIRPEPERQRRIERPSEPHHDGAVGRGHDSGPSHGSGDRGPRGDRGGGENGGGNRGGDTRPQHADKDGGEPNR